MANQTITLRSTEGKEVDFDILGYVDYEGKEYVILYPIAEDDGEVLILEVDGNENYLGLDDDDLIEAIFAKFKEEYYDEYDFGDEEDDDTDYSIEIELDPNEMSELN